VAVLRIKRRERNFLVVDKTCLQEKGLSWGAKGLHAYLMGMHHDWQVSVRDLINHATNGRDAVRALINELKNTGYISVETTRDDATGKFGRLEYVVHELSVFSPEPENQNSPLDVQFKPSPENPSSVKLPLPGNPAPVSPGPENPPLINNKYNKQQGNKEAAASKVVKDEVGELSSAPSAAAFSFPQKPNITSPKTSSAVLNPEETRIGDKLTSKQAWLAGSMVSKLSMDDEGRVPLLLEVKYCLLSPDCFKACGRDFSHKLNAIRVVIQRGEWQRPSGMVLQEEVKQTKALDELRRSLQEAYADAKHFQRLCRSSAGNAKSTFEKCVEEAQSRIKEMEERFNRVMREKEVQTC
jgi:hypothetical protein